MLAAGMTMNVLHISESDVGGGAARAGYRIHTALKERGEHSRMLVGRKLSADDEVRSIKRNLGWRVLDRACVEVLDRMGLQYVFYPSSFAVVSDPWFRWADLVQVHNTHGSYFSHAALPSISRRRPVVWLLHDMWPLTGHVAYSYECERWRVGCGACPYLHDYPPLPRDTSALLWRYKRRVYGKSRLTIVTPSRWLAQLAGESPLLRDFTVRHIPYGVETEVFSPRPSAQSRHRLGLPADRPIVLFVASNVFDKRKGFHLLEAAVRLLAEPPLVLVVGADRVHTAIEHRAITVEDDTVLVDAYSAADLLVLPSLADNFPNVVIESMACGTPSVAFEVGGVGEAVRHLETGYLAPPGRASALADGIQTLVADGDLRGRLSHTCRIVAEAEYSSALEADRFADLYGEMLEAR
jgi:glycosyltransferase involved in cell wall biosynthesis